MIAQLLACKPSSPFPQGISILSPQSIIWLLVGRVWRGGGVYACVIGPLPASFHGTVSIQKGCVVSEGIINSA